MRRAFVGLEPSELCDVKSSRAGLNDFIEIQDAPSDTSALVGLKEQAVTARFSVKKAYLVGSQFFLLSWNDAARNMAALRSVLLQRIRVDGEFEG